MATEETGMTTYQIEIQNADRTPIKRFYFDGDEHIAYAMFDEWTRRYDSTHTLELRDKRTHEVLPWGRVNGFEKWERV
ncbi:hypothetical protein ACIRU8_45730 [Streptomyces sp. NPDC101175]|uniref:hypothetical protein n=1 Tax=Streptomyces sp. NPDC101175 TaxID=3366123 RepID=UPI00383978E0